MSEPLSSRNARTPGRDRIVNRREMLQFKGRREKRCKTGEEADQSRDTLPLGVEGGWGERLGQVFRSS